jgi:DNA-binding IclR family transcriptional regulator
MNKSAAPALARGIKVLKILAENGLMSLEELAVATGSPKSSLLRILETLIEIEMVKKDTVSKRYQSLVAIVPAVTETNRFREQVKRALKQISLETLSTSEWYELSGDSMLITERYEPENQMVKVLAKIGYRRTLDSEFEAVARLCLAFNTSLLSTGGYWNYETGTRKPIEPDKQSSMLKEAANELAVMDVEYNPNGVRRYAAAVRKPDGTLAGIIALAENFTPSADAKANEKLQALKKYALDLEKNFN